MLIKNLQKTSAITFAVKHFESKKDVKLVKTISKVGLTQAIQSTKIDWIMEIIRLGHADINMRSNAPGKWTALIACTSESRVEEVKELLRLGANPNIRENDGWTALLFAVNRAHIPLMEMLLNAGADITVKLHNGKSVFDLATEWKKSKEVFDLLNKFKDNNSPSKEKPKIIESPPAVVPKETVATQINIKKEELDPKKIVLPNMVETAPKDPAQGLPKAPPKMESKKNPPPTSPKQTAASSSSATAASSGASSSNSQKKTTQQTTASATPRDSRPVEPNKARRPSSEYFDEIDLPPEKKPTGLLSKMLGFLGL